MSKTLNTILIFGACFLAGLGITGCSKKQSVISNNEIKSKGGYVLTADQCADTTIGDDAYQLRFLKSGRIKTSGFFSPLEDAANVLISASGERGRENGIYATQTFTISSVGDTVQGPSIGLLSHGEPVNLLQPPTYVVAKVTGGNTEYLMDDTLGIIPITN